ncbi:MAG TPA: hypothetical protein VJY39_01515 [Acidisphaera sp.]|nr:hypothetical protein [Acidisphaera sp.]
MHRLERVAERLQHIERIGAGRLQTRGSDKVVVAGADVFEPREVRLGRLFARLDAAEQRGGERLRGVRMPSGRLPVEPRGLAGVAGAVQVVGDVERLDPGPRMRVRSVQGQGVRMRIETILDVRFQVPVPFCCKLLAAVALGTITVPNRPLRSGKREHVHGPRSAPTPESSSTGGRRR